MKILGKETSARNLVLATAVFLILILLILLVLGYFGIEMPYISKPRVLLGSPL